MGLNPNVILAGRKVNDGMAAFVAEEILRQLAPANSSGSAIRFLILGLTFKEDVPIWKKEFFANGEAEWILGS